MDGQINRCIHIYIWHLEIFWWSDKLMYMKVLTNPILLEKQADTVLYLEASTDAKQWLQKMAGEARLPSGHTHSNLGINHAGPLSWPMTLVTGYCSLITHHQVMDSSLGPEGIVHGVRVFACLWMWKEDSAGPSAAGSQRGPPGPPAPTHHASQTQATLPGPISAATPFPLGATLLHLPRYGAVPLNLGISPFRTWLRI